MSSILLTFSISYPVLKVLFQMSNFEPAVHFLYRQYSYCTISSILGQEDTISKKAKTIMEANKKHPGRCFVFDQS